MLERRKAPRISFDVDVDVNDSHNFYVGRTKDISMGGLFIESPIPIEPGTELTLKLRIGGEPYVLACRAAWRLTTDEGHAHGFGVEFDRLPLGARRAIQSYMRRRAPELIDFDDDSPPPSAPVLARLDDHVGPPPLPAASPR